MLQIWGTNGKWAAQRVQCGKVRMKLGRMTKALNRVFLERTNVCNGALHVIGLYGLGDQVSLFLEDWGACEGDIKLSHWPGYVVPGNGLGLVVG